MGSYTTKRNLYKPSIGETGWGAKINQNFDILDDHKHVKDDITDFAHTHVRNDITDLLPIKRSDLEYPTEDVTFAYLVIIGKAEQWLDHWNSLECVTIDSFTDKAVKSFRGTNEGHNWGRVQDKDNYYMCEFKSELATEDHLIRKLVAGTVTLLGYEAVDLKANTYMEEIFSISGSTLKGFRAGATTPQISVTDTDFAEGLFTVGIGASGSQSLIGSLMSSLIAPLSELPQPQAIVEYDVVGEGTRDNDYHPDMPQDLIGVTKDQVTPEEWEAIQSNPKDANGNPIIDRLAVTWGAIDYKGEPTMLCAIYGGSPSYLDPDRIKRHIDDARAKGRKVFKPPKNVSEAKALYREIKRDFPDKLITENELAYQLIGVIELEVDAVADFYEREILNLNRIKKVPTWELHRTLDRWENLAKKHNRLEALNKIRRCKKK